MCSTIEEMPPANGMDGTNGKSDHSRLLTVEIELQTKEKQGGPTCTSTGEDVNGHVARQSKDNLTEENVKPLYTIHQTPPLFLSVILGFQHYLLMIGSITMPLISTAAMCIGNDNIGKSEVIATAFFVSGIGTLLQSTLGTRLPIVQSNSPTFLPPILTLMTLPQWRCPEDPPDHLANTSILEWRRDVWTTRMREVQGALSLSALAQVGLGLTGLVGLVLPYIGPLVITPSVALIGLSLFRVAATEASSHWGIAFLTVAVATLCSQYIRNINVPCFSYSRGRGWTISRYPIFKLLPILLAILVPWLLVVILTLTNALPSDPDHYGYKARADLNLQALSQAQWFRVPYPGQWGRPTFSSVSVVAMLASIFAGIVESVGDYYACARLSGAPPPPVHAVNRGVFMEGFGIILAGLWGTSTGLTSYSENVGAIGITKVGSRRVIQVAGMCMIFFGMLGKFGALFVIIPQPIVGGLFFVVFGMVTAVGLSNLQYVDLNSTRNLFILGLSLLLGLGLPYYMSSDPNIISTGSIGFDQILTVLLSTPMFIGGFVGFVLDNTVPGTNKERGIQAWRQVDSQSESRDITGTDAYDFPFGMSLVRRWGWTKYVPISPTFRAGCTMKGHCRGCCTKGDI